MPINIDFIKVRLRSSQIKIREDTDVELELSQQDADANLVFHVYNSFSDSAEIRSSSSGDEFVQTWIFHVRVGARAFWSEELEISDEKDFSPLFEVVAEFDPLYQNKSASDAPPELTHDEVKSLKKRILSDLWPYWVEYAQSSAVRVGFPGTLEVRRPPELSEANES